MIGCSRIRTEMARTLAATISLDANLSPNFETRKRSIVSRPLPSSESSGSRAAALNASARAGEGNSSDSARLWRSRSSRAQRASRRRTPPVAPLLQYLSP